MTTTYRIDPVLIDVAEWKQQHAREKQAFVPPGGGDPAAMGGDPAAMGMDPAAMGMDPAAMGGAMPPGGAPMPPAGGPPGDIMSALGPMIQQAVQQAVQQAMAGAGGTGAQAPTGPAGVGQKMKIDPTMVYLQLGRLTKMLIYMFEQMGWPIPPDVLNDDMMIQQAAGQAPSPLAQAAQGGEQQAAGGPPAIPGVGQSPAIQPITPPGGGGGAPAGGEKTGSIVDILRAYDLSDAAHAASLMKN